MPKWAVEKQYYEMPELVGFQTMVILDPNGMTFDAVCVFGSDFQLLFKSSSSYCEASCLESVQDFLINLDMKPRMHLVELRNFH